MKQISDTLIAKKALRDSLLLELKNVNNALKHKEKEHAVILQTNKLIQEAAKATLSNISMKIGNIVTKAITSVLNQDYTFHIDFKIAYGKLASDMYLMKDGFRYDLRKDNGDGVVDLVAIALRIAAICIDRRKLRKLLILDEPCGAVSVNFQPFVGEMLKSLSDLLDLQIIMVAAHGSNMNIEGAKYIDTSSFYEGAVV